MQVHVDSIFVKMKSDRDIISYASNIADCMCITYFEALTSLSQTKQASQNSGRRIDQVKLVQCLSKRSHRQMLTRVEQSFKRSKKITLTHSRKQMLTRVELLFKHPTHLDTRQWKFMISHVSC